VLVSWSSRHYNNDYRDFSDYDVDGDDEDDESFQSMIIDIKFLNHLLSFIHSFI
jgi:hypothetical protein